MLKAITAFTKEIDDADSAVAEILAQLDLSRLSSNSLGILTCYSEYLDSGVVKTLCDALPFDVIGCTTMSSATTGNMGHLELSLMVLTSDDVVFSAAVSAPLSDGQEAPLREMYGRASGKLGCDPALMLSFAPLMYNIGGEVFINILSDASGGIPNFGTLAVDHTSDYSESKVIFNGEACFDTLAMALIGGAVEPRFLVSSLSEEKTLKQKAIITASDANILKEVNGIPAVEYMESLGLTNNGKIEGASTIPFVVDFNDGTEPVIRAIFAQTPEGYAVCGGVMPVNATLSIGSIDYDDVLETTRKMIRNIGAPEKINAVILFSCVGRSFALGAKTMDEMQLLEDAFGKSVPYILAYSGGEICPLKDSDGKRKNRFHNDTIIACML